MFRKFNALAIFYRSMPVHSKNPFSEKLSGYVTADPGLPMCVGQKILLAVHSILCRNQVESQPFSKAQSASYPGAFNSSSTRESHGHGPGRNHRKL
jgi:hypothetical protein